MWYCIRFLSIKYIHGILISTWTIWSDHGLQDDLPSFSNEDRYTERSSSLKEYLAIICKVTEVLY